MSGLSSRDSKPTVLTKRNLFCRRVPMKQQHKFLQKYFVKSKPIKGVLQLHTGNSSEIFKLLPFIQLKIPSTDTSPKVSFTIRKKKGKKVSYFIGTDGPGN